MVLLRRRSWGNINLAHIDWEVQACTPETQEVDFIKMLCTNTSKKTLSTELNVHHLYPTMGSQNMTEVAHIYNAILILANDHASARTTLCVIPKDSNPDGERILDNGYKVCDRALDLPWDTEETNTEKLWQIMRSLQVLQEEHAIFRWQRRRERPHWGSRKQSKRLNAWTVVGINTRPLRVVFLRPDTPNMERGLRPVHNTK